MTLEHHPGTSIPNGAQAVFRPDTEMGRICLETDWGKTPLGPAELWPQSLKTVAAIVLASAFPKIVLWGPELVQIYNDAHIPFLGTKHPWGLGIPTRECWPEMWDFNEPIYERVLQGETIYFEDQLYTLARRGPGMPLEDVYFTLSYSPVRDETGVGGVLVTAIDTTGRVASERLREERDQLHRQIESERAQLRTAFDKAPSFMATLRGPDFVFEQANNAYYQLVGQRELIGKPVFDALPEVRGQGFEELLTQVVETGVPFVGREISVTLRRSADAPPEDLFVDLVYAPLVDQDGRPIGVFAHGSDVTDHVRGRKLVEQLLAESETARHAVERASAQALEQALELEFANAQLQKNASELKVQAEKLQQTALALAERTNEAELARRTVSAIVEAVTDGFVALDAEFRYAYVNGRAAEMWGLPPGALLGRTPDELWPNSAEPSLFIAMLKRVLSSGISEVGEGYAASLRCHIEMRVYPSSGGGIVAFFADITDRRRKEEAGRFMADASRLLASSVDYPTMLSNLATAAVPRLGDWCAVDILAEPDSPNWPPRIERVAVVHQDPAKVALARTLTTAFPQDWARDAGTPGVLRTRQPMFVPCVTDAMLAAGAQSDAHLAMLRELHFRSIIIVPLVARDRVLGALTLVMAESERRFTDSDLEIAVDLGQRAGAALDSARLLRDAQEANASKSQFLANMSHELRQPLNAITGYADLITMGVRGPVTDQQREDLERIKTSSTHLTSLIGDILQFAKIEAGQLLYKEAEFPVDATLREVVAFIEPQLRAKRLTFSLEVCDPNVAVRADRDRFMQAVINLLTNATKYTLAGGSITVSCEFTGPQKTTVAIRVTDTGIGISKDKLAAIFEPFVQINRSLSRHTEGVGLGLAIARDIARHMGGDLTAESEEGVGSTFTLTLPAPMITSNAVRTDSATN